MSELSKDFSQYHSRVKWNRQTLNSALIHTILKFFGEKYIGKFRSPVGFTTNENLFHVEIIEIEPNILRSTPSFMSQRWNIDNSGFFYLLNSFPKEGGEVKVSKMIGSHVQLKAIFGFFMFYQTHSCIVDQNVNMVTNFLYFFTELLNRLLICEIEGEKIDFAVFVYLQYLLDHLFGFRLISGSKDDLATFRSQLFNGFLPDSCTAASDYDHLIGQISICPADSSIEVKSG